MYFDLLIFFNITAKTCYNEIHIYIAGVKFEIFQNPDFQNSYNKILKHAVCLWQSINKLKL